MIRKPKLSEALDYGAELIIECDGCGRVFDAIPRHMNWALNPIREGKLYASPKSNICWHCHAVTWIRIEAPHFVAAANMRLGICTDGANILRNLVEKNLQEIRNHCRKANWKLEEFE